MTDRTTVDRVDKLPPPQQPWTRRGHPFRPYLIMLVFAAILGIPVSVVSYGFLALTTRSRSTFSTAAERPPRGPHRPGGPCRGWRSAAC